MSGAALSPWSHTERSHWRNIAAVLNFHFFGLSWFTCLKEILFMWKLQDIRYIHQLTQKESYFIFYHSAGLDWWPKILEFQLPGENKYSVEDI